MGEINLSNSNNRDAIVNTEAVRTPLRVRWLDEKGRQATNVRILRCTVDRDVLRGDLIGEPDLLVAEVERNAGLGRGGGVDEQKHRLRMLASVRSVRAVDWADYRPVAWPR